MKSIKLFLVAIVVIFASTAHVAAAPGGAPKALIDKLDSIETSVDGLDTKADTLQTSVDGLDTKADTLQTSVDGLDTKADTLQTSVDALSPQRRFWSSHLNHVVTNGLVSSIEVPGKNFTVNVSATCFFPSDDPANTIVISVPQGDGLGGDSAIRFEKTEEALQIQLTTGWVAGNAQNVINQAEIWAVVCFPAPEYNINFDTFKTVSSAAWIEE